MINLFKTGETEKLRQYIGEDLYRRQLSIRHLCVPIHTNAYYLAFYWCDIKEPHKNDERISIYCDERELAVFGNNEHFAEILKDLPENQGPFGALAAFLFELTAGDVDELESIENDINELERKIIIAKGTIRGVSSQIIEQRRSFLRMKRFYEQLAIVIDRLIENENEAIVSDALSRFVALSRRVHYLMQSVSDLREFVTQAREAYQARIDIEQNQLMKVFTVITAVFLPLTLIVGWYGMNFHIPEFNWRFGYLYVIILSVVVCVVCVCIFKRKKWF